MDFTEEEIGALVRYQNVDYRVINSLLRRGYEMRNTILEQTETMSDYLRLILEAQKNPTLKNSKQVEFATQEYNKWKELVISYNHQQYRILKNKIINQDNLDGKKKH